MNLLIVKKQNPNHLIFIKRGKRAHYLWTWEKSFVPNDVLGDSGPEMVSGAEVQIPVARH